MVRFIAFIVLFLLVISAYHDLNKIGVSTEPAGLQQEGAYREVVVRPGDTVLSVIEELNSGRSLPQDISGMIKDFSRLNPKANPYALSAGKRYRFPYYEKIKNRAVPSSTALPVKKTE